MKKEKKKEEFEDSWRNVVLLLLLTSFIVAAASIYMADKLFEQSLSREYTHYIQTQKQIQRQDENGCELKFNDGIYQENLRFVSAGEIF